MFTNIRVVIISVESFNIERLIVSRLQQLNAEVLQFNERPNNKNITKAVIRYKKSLIKNKLSKHYAHILKQTLAFEPTHIFILKGESVPQDFLELVKLKLPKCELICYNADSFKNNPNPKELIPFFDKVYTFDQEDARMLNLNYLPLFFEDDYIKSEVPKDLKFSFIGTIHTDRLHIVEKVKSQINPSTSFIHYYAHGFIPLLFQWVTGAKIPFSSLFHVRFNTIVPSKVQEIFKRTEIIVDIQHPNQSGLTMRTIQALGAGCKLITTNKNIVDHDFYNPSNILVLDRDIPSVSEDFLRADYQQISQDILKKYTLTNWLKTIFINNSII